MSKLELSRRVVMAGAAGTVALMASPLRAQGKPLTFILPNAPGSGVDNTTRTIQNELAKLLGTTIVINNQPGAGGIIGTQQMVRSAPDGTTLSVVSNNHVIYPSVLKSVPFDPIADITPIAILGATSLVMVVNPQKVSAKTAQELTAMFKAAPEKHTYASSGNGTILHLAAGMYVDQAQVKVTHVPYKGVAPMVTDLLSGQVDMGVLASPSVLQHIRSGALRAIGVATPKRVAVLPDVPTFVEQGMPNYVAEAWLACIGPAKMPAADVKRIEDAIQKTLATPEIKEALAKQGTDVAFRGAAEAAPFIKAELTKYADVVKKIGLEPQ